MLTSPELVWLLAAVAKGDEAALERLYRATRPKLYGVVLRILRRANLADEVMQETYLRVWGSAGELAVQLEEAKIALHECFDDLKKVEQLDERDQNRDRAAEDPRSDMDTLGALRARGAVA